MMQQIPISYPSKRAITDIGVKDEQRGGGGGGGGGKVIQRVDARVNLELTLTVRPRWIQCIGDVKTSFLIRPYIGTRMSARPINLVFSREMSRNEDAKRTCLSKSTLLMSALPLGLLFIEM